MKSALLLSLLLVLIPAAARAEVETFLPAKSGLILAQLSPEQRRALRERWEQAGPEERARIREEFHQRRQLDPERMERRREALENQRGERSHPNGTGFNGGFVGGFVDGYGAGFERRRVDDAPASGEHVELPPKPGMRPGGGSGFMPRPRQP